MIFRAGFFLVIFLSSFFFMYGWDGMNCWAGLGEVVATDYCVYVLGSPCDGFGSRGKYEMNSPGIAGVLRDWVV